MQNAIAEFTSIYSFIGNCGAEVFRKYGLKLLTRGIVSCVMVAGLFILFSHVISNQLTNKTQQVESAIAKTNTELTKLNTDIKIMANLLL